MAVLVGKYSCWAETVHTDARRIAIEAKNLFVKIKNLKINNLFILKNIILKRTFINVLLKFYCKYITLRFKYRLRLHFVNLKRQNIMIKLNSTFNSVNISMY